MNYATPQAESALAAAPGTSGPRIGVLADTPGFVITAALLVALGWVVGFGWVVGIAMVWMSRAWRTWEKCVATLLPPVVILLTIIIVEFVSLLGSPQPDSAAIPSPSVPALWTAITLFVPLSVAIGIWLIWRIRRRPIR